MDDDDKRRKVKMFFFLFPSQVTEVSCKSSPGGINLYKNRLAVRELSLYPPTFLGVASQTERTNGTPQKGEGVERDINSLVPEWTLLHF